MLLCRCLFDQVGSLVFKVKAWQRRNFMDDNILNLEKAVEAARQTQSGHHALLLIVAASTAFCIFKVKLS